VLQQVEIALAAFIKCDQFALDDLVLDKSSFANTAAIDGYRCVQSWPERVCRLKLLPRHWTCIRYPSNFKSYTHRPSPGGLVASVGSFGRMNVGIAAHSMAAFSNTPSTCCSMISTSARAASKSAFDNNQLLFTFRARANQTPLSTQTVAVARYKNISTPKRHVFWALRTAKVVHRGIRHSRLADAMITDTAFDGGHFVLVIVAHGHVDC